MNGEDLRVLGKGPAHCVHFRHYCPFIVEDLDLGGEHFLDQLDPVKMKDFRSDGVFSTLESETEFQRDLVEIGTLRLRASTTNRRRHCRVVPVRRRRGRCPTIVRRRRRSVRHCRERPGQILRGIYVEILVWLTDLDVSKILVIQISNAVVACQRAMLPGRGVREYLGLAGARRQTVH